VTYEKRVFDEDMRVKKNKTVTKRKIHLAKKDTPRVELVATFVDKFPGFVWHHFES